MREKKWIAFYPVFYRILYAVLLAGVLILGFGSFLGIRNIGASHWILLVVVLGLLAWFQHGKISAKIISAVLFFLCITVIIPIVGAGTIKEFWENYYLWIIVRKGFHPEWILGYELLQTLWIVLGCYVFQILTQKIQIIKEISAIALLALLILCMIFESNINRIGVALIIVYILICVSERIRLNWQKVKQSEDKRGYIMWLAPFFLAYLIVLCYIPPKDEPYEWSFFKEVYGNIREKVVIWFEETTRNGKEDFGSFLTGFSEHVEVGGNVKKDNRELMTIQGSGSLVTNLYLGGKAYDTFTGREWKQKVSQDMMEYPLDALELLYAVHRFDGERTYNYVMDSRITLQYGFFDTGYLFVPLKTSYVRDAEFKVKGREFSFGLQKGYGTNYGIMFYQMNLKTAEFQELIHSRLAEDEVLWEDVASRYAPAGMKDLSLADLHNYRKDIQEMYYDEVVISEQVENYLAQITEACNTPYERLLAIEKELTSFVYNRNPGKLPKDVHSEEDFLDYFLLESREGYCTYFATAFVLLARAEGFPARYVEGFCVPVNQSREMRVTSGMAHAWPEVYIEGIGWVPFEPTPGYSNLRYMGWEVRYPQSNMDKEPVESTPMPIEPATQQEEAKEHNTENAGAWLNLLKLIGIILPLCLLVLFLENLYHKRAYQKLTIEQRYVVEIRCILWLLEKAGYKRDVSETISELQDRIGKGLPEIYETEQDLYFLTGYEEYLYGDETVSDEMLESVIYRKEELLLWLKEKNKVVYLWIKLILFVSGY